MKIEKICNFYASKYHLSIMLLEYLKERNLKKFKVETFLQNEIEDEINVLTENIILKDDNNSRYYVSISDLTEEDVTIEPAETKQINFKTTKNIYDKEIDKSKNIIFIVEGNLNYIQKANEYIQNSIKENANIKIINCFNFSHQKLYMKEIISKSDKILYTTGEKIID